MPNNLNTAAAVNHVFDFELGAELSSADNENLADTLDLLRSACVAARRVLCEAVLRDDFEHDGATDAISSLNNALMRSSFLN